MFNGILQRLTIIEQRSGWLVLRELPLLDWLLAFGLLLIAIILTLANVTITSVLAVIVAVFFVAQGRVRLITFDGTSGMMQVTLQTPLQRTVALELELDAINRAYLYKGDDGGTQIVLVQADGAEMGLSAYARDTSAWKESVVIAINALLHDVRQADN